MTRERIKELQDFLEKNGKCALSDSYDEEFAEIKEECHRHSSCSNCPYYTDVNGEVEGKLFLDACNALKAVDALYVLKEEILTKVSEMDYRPDSHVWQKWFFDMIDKHIKEIEDC